MTDRTPTPGSRARATWLSGCRRRGSQLSRAVSPLARLSLALASLSMLSGCIVEDPPPYQEPTQTRPQLDLRAARPPQNRFIVVGQGDPIEFRVPFTSEDVGTPLLAFLYLDGGSVGSVEVPPGTLDEIREIVLTYGPGPPLEPGSVALGCHRFTLRVSHKDNFSLQVTGQPLDPSRATEAYWWVNVIDLAAGDDGRTLRNCPGGLVAP